MWRTQKGRSEKSVNQREVCVCVCGCESCKMKRMERKILNLFGYLERMGEE